jgi:23S rRNA pseudouridine2605 synthase
LIASGRVRVNGHVATLGKKVDPVSDRVSVDGSPIGGLPGMVHYIVNKPRGVVTTARDPEGRTTVSQLVPKTPRVFSVGRLDADTEGLLVMTNDGDLAQRLAHPSHGVEKEYLAKVKGTVGHGTLRRLRQGVELDDGLTAPARASVVGDPAQGVVRIVLQEGRNRQVRRMLEAVGHEVVRLVRVRVGPIRLRDLQPGEWRHLTPREVHSLSAATKPARRAPGARRASRAPRERPSRPDR